MTMNTKRMPVALLVVAAIITVISPARVAAQTERSSPAAPRRERVAAIVQEAYDKFKNETKGKNADYIPYLAKVDSTYSASRSSLPITRSSPKGT